MMQSLAGGYAADVHVFILGALGMLKSASSSNESNHTSWLEQM